jgi:2-polyprenyl-6-methoxyphenol hydroxylase-like FAD-dependent oxidoreductase
LFAQAVFAVEPFGICVFAQERLSSACEHRDVGPTEFRNVQRVFRRLLNRHVASDSSDSRHLYIRRTQCHDKRDCIVRSGVGVDQKSPRHTGDLKTDIFAAIQASPSGDQRNLFIVMKVLIAGCGIAGPTLAYWLAQYGFEPTVVEKASKLRTGGYIIDFWGAGFDIAERMGLVPELSSRGYRVKEVRVVNGSGKRIAGFPADAFERATRGRYISLPRGDLAASIFGKIEGKVETIFDDSVSRIEQMEKDVRVTFERGAVRQFDIVIGADGLHSRVRDLVFGSQNRFEKYLGYKTAAFQVEGYSPRDELVYVMYTQVGRQIARFAMRDDRTMFLLTFADEGIDESADLQAQKALLKERFANSGWECPRILDALDAGDDLYFDRVSQIRMNPLDGLSTRGRVTLVGDAAFCVSLLAGQGSALAMAASYILAGELYRAKGDYAAAFSRYQELFGSFVQRKQKSALRFAGAFAPKSKFALFLRNQIMSAFRIPWFADLAIGRDLADKIALPNY